MGWAYLCLFFAWLPKEGFVFALNNILTMLLIMVLGLIHTRSFIYRVIVNDGTRVNKPLGTQIFWLTMQLFLIWLFFFNDYCLNSGLKAFLFQWCVKRVCEPMLGYNDSRRRVEVEDEKAHWGEWNRWSDCSAECGYGLRSRVRKCRYKGYVHIIIEYRRAGNKMQAIHATVNEVYTVLWHFPKH